MKNLSTNPFSLLSKSQKIILLLATASLSSISLSAQTFEIKNNWNLLGAMETVDVSKFDNKCVDFIWKYVPTDTVNPWKIHIANGQTYAGTSSFGTFTSIGNGEGFWVKGNGNCNIDTTSTYSGVVTKGYLSGSTVWADFNMNGFVDSSEITMTDDNGKFQFNQIPSSDIVITISGGKDMSTIGTPIFMGSLQMIATANSTMGIASPITTLVATAVKSGVPLAEAKTAVATSLGISEMDIDINPLIESTKSVSGAKLLLQSLKVARVIELIVESGGVDNLTFADITKAVSQQIIEAPNVGIDNSIKPSNISTHLLQNGKLATSQKVAFEQLDNKVNNIVTAISAFDTTQIIDVNSLESATALAKEMVKLNETAKISITTFSNSLKVVDEALKKNINLLELAIALNNSVDTVPSAIATTATPVVTPK